MIAMNQHNQFERTFGYWIGYLKYAYETLVKVLTGETRGIFFLDALGGTGEKGFDYIDFGDDSRADWTCIRLVGNRSYVIGKRSTTSKQFSTEVVVEYANQLDHSMNCAMENSEILN